MYESYFGFSEKPFNITPNPRFIFLSKTHQEVFAHLLYGLQNRVGFIEITGEVGTGKTTVLRALFDQLDEDRYRLALIFNPRLTVIELLRSINREFGLPDEGKTNLELTSQLNRFLLDENRANRTPVLVIDEAQNLSVDVLEQIRLLSNLETDSDKLIQIVLVGQPELADNLNRQELRQLKQRITVRYHLGRLDQDDTVAYIRHRLAVAAGPQDLFAPSALKVIYQQTRGLPRLINVLCDRACLVCYSDELKTVTPKVIRRALQELESAPVTHRGGQLRSLLLGAALASAVLFAGWVLLHERSDAPLPGTVANAGPAEQSASLPKEVPAPEPPTKASDVVTEEKVPARTVAVVAPVVPQAAKAPAPQKVTRPKPAPVRPAPKAEIKPAPRPVAEKPVRVAAPKPLSALETAHLAALNAVRTGWQLKPLSGLSLRSPDDFRQSLEKGGLQVEPFSGSLDRLLSLDTPVLVQLRHEALNQGQPVWTALVARTSSRWIVEPGLLPDAELTRFELQQLWTGQALVPWKDFRSIGSRHGHVSVETVKSLQALLQQAGYAELQPTGQFDRDTVKAIGNFQARHGLEINGEVNAETLILLYQSAQGLSAPQLTKGLRG